jgi:hypothetical protein
MIDRQSLRTPVSTLLLVFILGLLLPSGSLQAADAGMLSARAESGAVHEALVADADSPDAEKNVSPEGNGRQSPGTVALISAVLPGYGQVYNNAAWKLPIYYGLLAWFGSNALHDSDQYDKYRDLYLENPTSDAASQRDSYRKKRNTQIALFCVTYVLGIVDAYVDAHLYDFDRIIDDNAGASALPSGSTTILSVSRKF